MKLFHSLTILSGLCGGLLTATAVAQTNAAAPWVSLFNGKDLTGWTIKGDATGKAWVDGGQINGVPVTHLVHGKYSEGYIAFKFHSLGDRPEQPKVLGHFRNIRIITEKPAAWSQAMELPAKVIE
jgi:hypothetical protein